MKTRSFVIGLVVCGLVFVALGGIIRALNAGNHRPEGAAERWLAAVSDITRKGVRADAEDRADKIGPWQIGEPLLVKDPDRKGSFPDLEVGKATIDGDRARVPYRLHQRDVDDAKLGVIVLDQAGDDWKITRLDANGPTELVPSDGGSPPSSAPVGLWVIAMIAGVGVTVGASLLVEWATRTSRRVLAST